VELNLDGDFVRQAVAILLSANQLIAYWLAGNKNNLGWLLGVLGGVPWAVFIIVWDVWGLAPLVVGLQIIYIRNLMRWWRESRSAEPALDPPVVAPAKVGAPSV
jgi:Flp pilus assembly protein TadB